MFFLIQTKEKSITCSGYSRKNHLTTCISFSTMRIPDFIKHSVHVSSKLFFVILNSHHNNNVFFYLKKNEIT